jgi:hypothetical protein
MGSRDRILVNPELSFFFHAAEMLFYMKQRIYFPKFRISRKSVSIHHCVALLQVVLVSIPPQKFVHPPCWYYQLQEIEKYEFRANPMA